MVRSSKVFQKRPAESNSNAATDLGLGTNHVCSTMFNHVPNLFFLHTATHCNTLQRKHRNTMPHTATHCRQHTATHCNTLQHRHHNTLQDIATQYVVLLCFIVLTVRKIEKAHWKWPWRRQSAHYPEKRQPAHLLRIWERIRVVWFGLVCYTATQQELQWRAVLSLSQSSKLFLFLLLLRV